MRATEVVRINSEQDFRWILSAADYAAISTYTVTVEKSDGTIAAQTPSLNSAESSIDVTVAAADNNMKGEFTASCYVNGRGLDEVIKYTVKGAYDE